MRTIHRALEEQMKFKKKKETKNSKLFALKILTAEIVNKVTQVVHFYEYSMKNSFKKNWR